MVIQTVVAKSTVVPVSAKRAKGYGFVLALLVAFVLLVHLVLGMSTFAPESGTSDVPRVEYISQDSVVIPPQSAWCIPGSDEVAMGFVIGGKQYFAHCAEIGSQSGGSQ